MQNWQKSRAYERGLGLRPEGSRSKGCPTGSGSYTSAISGSRLRAKATTSLRLGFGDFERVKSDRQAAHKCCIIGLADAHARVRDLHVATQIDRRPSGSCGDKINRQLAFAVVRIGATGARPKSAEQRILSKPWKQIIDDRSNCVVPTQSGVKGCGLFWHGGRSKATRGQARPSLCCCQASYRL